MKQPIKGSTSKKADSKDPKANYNMKIKVSQATIDKVKSQGMTKALSQAGKNPVAAGTTPKTKAQAEYVEAVRRLYGETRFQNAIYKAKASPGPSAPRGAMNPNKF